MALAPACCDWLHAESLSNDARRTSLWRGREDESRQSWVELGGRPSCAIQRYCAKCTLFQRPEFGYWQIESRLSSLRPGSGILVVKVSRCPRCLIPMHNDVHSVKSAPRASLNHTNPQTGSLQNSPTLAANPATLQFSRCSILVPCIVHRRASLVHCAGHLQLLSTLTVAAARHRTAYPAPTCLSKLLLNTRPATCSPPVHQDCAVSWSLVKTLSTP
ncbi:hypothetical protein CC78DRAFT_585259 [Lojkania enalia]|uniref:Uncharacterized protein n=1 Tax=Lojkania enalia TaxID=147567 RepID=A0A9P4K2C9_9PLEO|nr:hypothetical protein CC78DRAFT_585259 [Didymosphaeria enalia]